MRLLGLRGLYLEAERLGDHRAARHYAGRAADVAPQLAWAAESTLGEKIAQGDWDGALKLVDAQKSTRQADRDATARRRCVLLTAKATALMDTDPTAARNAALEANRLRPDFAPAAVAAARALFRNNDTRKGAKILETAWKAEPHPEIADLYTHARHGDAVNDRLARARKLQSIKQNHAESSLAVARGELEAGHHAEARAAAQAAIRMRPTEGAWLLLADIEEAETGDIGKVRELLGRAVRAPRDPAWVADGVETDTWAPVSPVTGRLDAFEWRVPVERLGKIIDDREPETARELTAPAEDAPAAPPPASAAPVAAATAPPAVAQPEPVPAPVEIVAAEPAAEKKPAIPPAPANDHLAPPPQTSATLEDPSPAEGAAPATVVEAESATPPLPDDPGVDPDDASKTSRRFKLF
jgi:HemY protein